MSFKNIVFGTALMSSVRMLRLLVQFIAIPILSRLLSPADFGLMALAMPFAMFGIMMADAGIGMSLVRTPMSDRHAWSTSFWLTLLLGCVLTLVMAAIAPLAAYLFHEPSLAPMILALSLVVFLQALHLIPVAALQQVERFRTIASVEVVTMTLSIGAAIYLALHGAGAWALVWQQLIQFGMRSLLICFFSPFRPLRIFDWHDVREHVRFGKNVLGTALINYGARSFDSWVVGKALGTTMLGFYSMAFQFARLPIMMVTAPLQFVVYSQLSKLKDDKAAIAQAFLLITRLLAILVIPAMGIIAAAEAPVFTFILSSKWVVAGELFQMLAPASTLLALLAVGETILYTLGRPELQLRTAAEYTAVWLFALCIAIAYGFVGAALAFNLASLLYAARYLRMLLPILGLSFGDYLRPLVIPTLTCLAGIGAYEFIALKFTLVPLQGFVIAVALSTFAILAALILQRQRLLADIRSWKSTPEATR